MNTIEIFVGKRNGLDQTEKIVLSRVVDWLARRGKQAVIFWDIWLGKRQVDILVATETVTLQLEVKGWRSPVTGGQNGDWEIKYPNGKVRDIGNAYRQALENNQALRSEMAQLLGFGAHVSYPQGAVIFEPQVPPNSNVDTKFDKRVLIRGSADLGDLLSMQAASPWPLSWMRDFARARRLIRLSPSDTTVPAQARSVGGAAKAFERMNSGRDCASASRADAAAEELSAVVAVESSPSIITPPRLVVPGWASATDTRHGAQPAVMMSESFRYTDPPRSRIGQRLLRSTPIVCALFVAAYLFKSSWPLGHAIPVAPSGVSMQSGAPHQDTPLGVQLRARRSIGPKTTRIRPANDRAGTAGGNSMNPSTQVAQPSAPITCPAGVDRLGCNGRIGVFSAPECPPGFFVSGNSCTRAAGG